MWTQGVLSVLATVPGATASQASHINDAGQIVGFATVAGITHATVWNNGVPTQLPSPSGKGGTASSINDAGQAAGTSGGAPTVWNGATPTLLELAPGLRNGTAAAINLNGLIAGSMCCRMPSGYNVAAVWHGTTPTLLPKPTPTSSTYAYAVNKSGIVVGFTIDAPVAQAVAWMNNTVTILAGSGTATAINDRGIIVGSGTIGSDDHAVFWNRIGGAMQDLNTLVDPSLGIDLNVATGINNQCSIVASGLQKGYKVAVLLTLNDPSKCATGVL